MISAVVAVAVCFGQTTKQQTKTESNTNRQILDKLLPFIIEGKDLEKDKKQILSYLKQSFPKLEINIYEDGTIRYNDDEEIIAVTRLLDDENTFAVTYSEINSLMVFYRLHNEQWKTVGSRKSVMPVYFIKFEELNGKPCREIVTKTFSIIAYSYNECFVYFHPEDTIKFAGSFISTDYKVDLENKTISVTFEGSNSSNQHKTMYGWHDDMLMELRKSVIVVPDDWHTNDERILEYYQTNDYNQPIKLIFREQYDKRNKKHQRYWDNFFEADNSKIEIE